MWSACLFYFLEQLFDAKSTFFGKVEREMKFRQTPHLQTLDEFVTDIPGSVLERLDGSVLLFESFERTTTKIRACFMSG